MIEIFSILCQLIIFITIFSFPFTPKILNNSIGSKKTFNIIDAHTINVIFFLYLSLLISFTGINLIIFFKIYFVLAVVFILFNLKKLSKIFNNENITSLFLFLLIVLSIFSYLAQNLRLESDGHMWLEKVLIFYNGYDIQAVKEVPSHPEYPHLGSYIWAFFWKNSILNLEYFGRYFQPYFYVLSIFLIINNLSFNNKKLKILLILFLILISFEPYLLGGYQEYLIFTTIIVAIRYVLLIDFNNPKNLNIISLVLLILYINCWFKDEGVVYFIIFGLLLIYFINIKFLTKIYFFLFMAFLLILQIILQKYLIGIHGFPHNNLIELFNLLNNPEILFIKILKISEGVMISFIKYPLWLLTLFSLLVYLIFIKKYEKLFMYVSSCLILNLAFIFVVFLGFSEYEWYISVTLDRLMFQTSGLYLIFSFLLVKDLKIFQKK